MKAAWSGSGCSGLPRPSMVMTSRLPTVRDGVMQERMARPPTRTVHAPHCARPQPKCVPVSPRSLRSTYSSGTSGSSESISRVRPFTRMVILAMAVSALLGGHGGGRPHAPHLDHRLLALGAVVVHLAAVVDHVAPRGGGHRAVRVELPARAHPPRARDHHEEAVVGMEMRAAHVAGKPPDMRHVRAGLARIAEEDGLLVGARGVAHPLDLRGWREVHRGAVELGGDPAGQRDEENGENGRKEESLDAAHAVSYRKR